MTKSGETNVKEEVKELSSEKATSDKVDTLDEAEVNDNFRNLRFTLSAAPQTTAAAPHLPDDKSDSDASSKNAASIETSFEKASEKAQEEEEQDHILDISDIKLGLHTKETKSISLCYKAENFDVLNVDASLSQR